jgi:transcriptional regulator with XRE-family HTH domain
MAPPRAVPSFTATSPGPAAVKSPSNIDKYVGGRIRQRRRDLRVPMFEIATQLGVSQAQYQKYEVGKNRVSAARLAQIAALLGVDLPYFFRGIGEGKDQASLIGGIADEDMRRDLFDLGRAVDGITDPETRGAFLNLCALLGAQERRTKGRRTRAPKP